MKRRTYLRVAGVAGAAGLAGCLGDGDGGDRNGDRNGDGDSDGDGSDHEAANEFGYDTTVNNGVEVPLVPTADAIEWFEDEEAVFVDARGPEQFEELRIADAVLSPAPEGLGADDPISELSADTRLVTYCVCPHTLATSRGATLIQNGYVHAYALDEGLQEWIDQGHPIEGDESNAAGSVEFDHDYEDQL